jgi:hypothetical protein
MADFSTEFLFSLTAKLDKPLDVGQTPQSTARFFMPPVVILTDPNYVVWFFSGVEIG